MPPAPRFYVGRAGDGHAVFVQEGDIERPLNPHLHLHNHSPTGFCWGYGGSGPAQLALALIADATGDAPLALRTYQIFKARFIIDKDFAFSGVLVAHYARTIDAELIAAAERHV